MNHLNSANLVIKENLDLNGFNVVSSKPLKFIIDNTDVLTLNKEIINWHVDKQTTEDFIFDRSNCAIKSDLLNGRLILKPHDDLGNNNNYLMYDYTNDGIKINGRFNTKFYINNTADIPQLTMDLTRSGIELLKDVNLNDKCFNLKANTINLMGIKNNNNIFCLGSDTSFNFTKTNANNKILIDLKDDNNNCFIGSAYDNIYIDKPILLNLLSVNGGGQSLILKDVNQTNKKHSYLSFYNFNNTRKGYIGYPGDDLTTLNINNEIGNIEFNASTNINFNSSVNFNTNIILNSSTSSTHPALIFSDTDGNGIIRYASTFNQFEILNNLNAGNLKPGILVLREDDNNPNNRGYGYYMESDINNNNRVRIGVLNGDNQNDPLISYEIRDTGHIVYNNKNISGVNDLSINNYVSTNAGVGAGGIGTCHYIMKNNNVVRWCIGLTENESTTDLEGSTFDLYNYYNGGGFHSRTLTITRNNLLTHRGSVVIEGNLNVGGSINNNPIGNINYYNGEIIYKKGYRISTLQNEIIAANDPNHDFYKFSLINFGAKPNPTGFYSIIYCTLKYRKNYWNGVGFDAQTEQLRCVIASSYDPATDDPNYWLLDENTTYWNGNAGGGARYSNGSVLKGSIKFNGGNNEFVFMLYVARKIIEAPPGSRVRDPENDTLNINNGYQTLSTYTGGSVFGDDNIRFSPDVYYEIEQVIYST